MERRETVGNGWATRGFMLLIIAILIGCSPKHFDMSLEDNVVNVCFALSAKGTCDKR